ncbi:hypothetical protein OIV83_005750 [Microbotryomycetes sp. JL201]|nr:hypothetical protein OIV83_005750 [Microbotryomycetes sp. JL201]
MLNDSGRATKAATKSHLSTPSRPGRTSFTLNEDSSELAQSDSDTDSSSAITTERQMTKGMSLWDMMRLAEQGARKIDSQASNRQNRSDRPVRSDATDGDSDSDRLSASSESESVLGSKRPPLPTAEAMRTLVALHKSQAITRRQAWLDQNLVVRGEIDAEQNVEIPGDSNSRSDDSSAEDSKVKAPTSSPSSRFSRLALRSSHQKGLSQSTLSPLRQAAPTSSPSKLEKFIKVTCRKRDTAYTSSDDRINRLQLPDFFQSTAFGSRTLRRRVAWIVDTAQTLYSDSQVNKEDRTTTRSAGRPTLSWFEREVARKTGRTDEWWRRARKLHEFELDLNLSQSPEFRQKFCTDDNDATPEPTTALYRAFVEHVKLCRHVDETCRYYHALATFHSYRLPKGTSSAKLPTKFGIEQPDVRREWQEFAQQQEIFKRQFSWSDPLIGTARTPSPRKRKRE